MASQYWIDDTTEEILYGGAKGGGKSYLGASLIFGDALIYPETHYFIARKNLTDLRNFTIPTIYEVFGNWGIKLEDYAKFDGTYNRFNLYNGSRVYLISCKENPSDPLFESFGSMTMTRGWIEEGGEVSENAKANLWLSIGRWKNEKYGLKKKLLITANPKKGWMKREFIDLVKNGTLPINKKYIQAFATDNLYLSGDYIETLSNEKNIIRRQRLFEGNWDYDEDQDSLVSYDAMSDAFSNTIVKDNNKYLIADIARFGKDTTVFSYWDGLELYKIEQFSKQDTFNTKEKLKDRARIEKIPFSNIMVDEDGVGGGVVDGLPGIRGFVANSTPLPTLKAIESRIKYLGDFTPKNNFRNLKSQCGYKLAQLLEERKIAIRTEEYRDIILEELGAILRQKDIDSDGKLQIKPKEDVKEILGKSPDIADTLLMRMWFELKKDALDETDPNDEEQENIRESLLINSHRIINNSNK